jgi:hypothetical protein
MATSMSVRILVSGVRSSCDALATNRFWLAKATSSLPSAGLYTALRAARLAPADTLRSA